jgi:hypothetical protein
MFKVDGHRAPYGVLIPVQILLAFACLANTTLTIFDNIDQLPPTRAYAAVQAVSSLFTNWGLALLFFALVLVVRERQDRYRALTKRDSIVLGQRVMVTIAGSHLLFSVVFGLGTTTGVMATNAYNALSSSGERFEKRYDTYRNTLYASQAFYYITAGALIYLAHSLFKLMRSTHVADTVSPLCSYPLIISQSKCFGIGHQDALIRCLTSLCLAHLVYDVVSHRLQSRRTSARLQQDQSHVVHYAEHAVILHHPCGSGTWTAPERLEAGS